jgi:hypothetical protein
MNTHKRQTKTQTGDFRHNIADRSPLHEAQHATDDIPISTEMGLVYRQTHAHLLQTTTTRHVNINNYI